MARCTVHALDHYTSRVIGHTHIHSHSHCVFNSIQHSLQPATVTAGRVANSQLARQSVANQQPPAPYCCNAGAQLPPNTPPEAATGTHLSASAGEECPQNACGKDSQDSTLCQALAQMLAYQASTSSAASTVTDYFSFTVTDRGVHQTAQGRSFIHRQRSTVCCDGT